MSQSINERSLLKYALNPLREIVCQKVSVIEQVAEELLQYSTWQTYEAVVPTISTMREYAYLSYETKAGAPDVNNLLSVTRLALRFRDLLALNDVLNPESPYQLSIGGFTIDGTATVLRGHSRPSVAEILRLRSKGSPRVLGPDAVSLSRWLYGKRECEFPFCTIYNYWIHKDRAVNQDFSEDHPVESWLLSAASAFSQHEPG
jgi:hypothetical protein